MINLMVHIVSLQKIGKIFTRGNSFPFHTGLDPLQSHESLVKSCPIKINACENFKC